jgi:hypothetical protein
VVEVEPLFVLGFVVEFSPNPGTLGLTVEVPRIFEQNCGTVNP